MPFNKDAVYAMAFLFLAAICGACGLGFLSMFFIFLMLCCIWK
jgi:hypothetical protein